MTVTEFRAVQSGTVVSPTTTRAFLKGSDEARSSRFWRTIWRVHFYSGIFAMPILVLFSITGLTILYTQPIHNLLHGNLTEVHAVTGAPVATLDRQRAVAEASQPEWTVAGVTPAADARHSTVFAMTKGGEATKQVFVDPNGPRVLGSMTEGGDLIGLANRMHGNLNNSAITVPLPTFAGIAGKADNGRVLQPVPVGEVVLEVFACWALVLGASGLYLWWPRKGTTARRRFLPRRGTKGRARLRDLHAFSGVVLAGLLVFFVATGLAWSSFWGSNWKFVAKTVTHGKQIEKPASTLARTGDLNRFGNPIPWAIADHPVPASTDGLAANGSGHTHHVDYLDVKDAKAASSGPAEVKPATLSLAAIAKVAADERMRPGYSIALPMDKAAPNEKPVYGTYVLSNPWPARVHDQRSVYVDQFSGRTLATATGADAGLLSEATSVGIDTHMGTQFGLFSRIAMTVGTLAVLFSVVTAFAMWWRRRPTGRAGLPRRPADVGLHRGLAVGAVVLALVYPLWGVSCALVLLIDRYVIRRVPKLRTAFGTR